jgi:hypothetical protein
MIVVLVLVVLGILAFVAASVLFGADSRTVDPRCAVSDWPGRRHGS